MVSTVKGPIPPHPYYDNDPQPIDRPVPKIKPEGGEYAYKGTNGSVGLLLQINDRGYRLGSASAQRKMQAESSSKDHVKDNVRRMRHIQKETKKRQEESKQPVKALWKSTKYENVSSKVRDNLQKEPCSRPSSAGNYLRSHSRTGWAPVPRSRPSSCEPPDEKLTIPKAESAREVKFAHHDIDFVKANGRAARNFSMKRSPSVNALDDYKKKQEEEIHTYRKGEVPSYLVNRQRSWQREEEERRAAIPDPDMPPGHKLMPDEERRNTLVKLKQTQKDLLTQMSSLPVRTDTLRLRKRKEELDSKLAEVEEAIKIFSRPKVFVRMDD